MMNLIIETIETLMIVIICQLIVHLCNI